MRDTASQEQIAGVVHLVTERGYTAHVEQIAEGTTITVVDSDDQLEVADLDLPGVVRIDRAGVPYPLANRGAGRETTRVRVGSREIGGAELFVIGGPCAVESADQINRAARDAIAAGADALRAGAFKPRRSPYTFQGLRHDGLRLLSEARRRHGVPVVSEITSETQLDAFLSAGIDMLQIGARNMTNSELLRAVATSGLPVLLKRGFAATLDDLLLAAEYLLVGGNPQVVLCERGIRTFEPATRFTLDLNGVAWLLERTHLPVIVDPSHGTGDHRLVEPLSMAAVAAGAHGLLIEMHPDPVRAQTDAGQQLSAEAFARTAARCRSLWSHLREESLRSV
jgi:3-deoxy-7-phosphoheptulonate synthase